MGKELKTVSSEKVIAATEKEQEMEELRVHCLSLSTEISIQKETCEEMQDKLNEQDSRRLVKPLS